ncbi:ExbD/TolR family protein [Qipengyuania flava]|uniref:ExbD/TolR family protein n=1 Tax=Qipengyuania flava TaxID=192812 RepID=UPI00215B5297|nr:biopolymer transporter ExbD [Qipengyuania flava]
MPYGYRTRAPLAQPMSDMNITPLIDVLLVLLIMFIMVIPIATHTLLIPVPNGAGRFEVQAVNTVHIDQADRLYWNGRELDRQALLNQLATTASTAPEALLRFEPDARASYDASAKTIALIKDSGIERFAFVGNEKYRAFPAD